MIVLKYFLAFQTEEHGRSQGTCTMNCTLYQHISSRSCQHDTQSSAQEQYEANLNTGCRSKTWPSLLRSNFVTN
jgi:hypothetical protein